MPQDVNEKLSDITKILEKTLIQSYISNICRNTSLNRQKTMGKSAKKYKDKLKQSTNLYLETLDKKANGKWVSETKTVLNKVTKELD